MPVTLIDFPQRDNYSLSFNYGFNHNFEVYIPLEEAMKLSFKIDQHPLIPKYAHNSRLSNVSRYMLSQNYLVCDMGDHIQVIKRSALNTFKKEFKTLFNILKERQPGWRTGLLLRLLYFIYYPFYKDKHIWIFMDLPYRADDNAFHLFRYMVEENISDVEKYFAISKHDYQVHDVEIMANKYQSSSKLFKIRRLLGLGNPSSEYQKIADIGFDIPFRSIRHRIYSLFAEVIVSSNPDNNIIYPFWGNFEYLAGLVRSKTVFLQHGVTKDDTSSWLNKYDKNLDLIVCVSDEERQSFIDNPYGYPKEAIKVLGFPRFDNLEVLEDRKEVIVMPTWRRHYNDLDDEDFARTTFFNAFNNLLNDEELIEFLESKGYTLVLKPHPNLYKHVHLFDRHPNVKFIDRSYNEIFNHSSLLVTDYSSVFFDFAFLEKPLIYYQYGKDYHFNVESGYFDYETMGFGPVEKTHGDVKEAIMKYVSNGCEMEEVYKKRVDDFFMFRDKENSRRVYEAIRNIDFNR